MNISTDVRPRASSDAVREPSSYTFAGGATSFLSILSQINRPAEDADAGTVVNNGDTDETSAPNSRDVAPVADENTAPQTAPEEVESADQEPETTVSEVQAEGEENLETEADSTFHVSDEASTAEQAGENQIPDVIVASPAGGQSDTPDTIETSTTRAATSPEAISAERALGAAATKVVTAPAEGDENTDSLPIDGIEISIEEPSIPPTTIPRNLNAVLAEGAVRGNSDTRNESEKALRVESLVNPDVATVDTSADDSPAPPALPQSTAMESGGVRPEAAAVPRVPLANLPGELAQQLHMMQQEGVKTMRLRLVPEHLGELHIEIQGTGDTMRVRLVSANAAVRDALSGQMGDLKDALQKQGLSLDQASVDSGGARQQAKPDQDHTPAPTYRESAAPSSALPRSTGPRNVISQPLNSNAINVLA